MELKPEYKQTEAGVVPAEWKSTTVRGLASAARNAIVGGPFGSDLVSLDYVEQGIPVIRGQNMSGQWVSGTFVFVTPSKAKSLEANLARPGDIIFTQRGTLGQVSLIPEKPFESYLVSQSQMKLSVNREIADPLFCFYIFTSEKQQDLIRAGTIQTGIPHINLGILRGIPVQLPCLPEQRAIAAALSDTDALIGSLDQLIAKKRDLKQAAMQQLLTPPSSGQAGQRCLPGFPGEWEVRRLGEIGSFSKGRGLAKSDLSLAGSMPAIPYTAIYTDFDEVVDVSKIKQFASTREITVINSPHVLIASSSNMLENIGKATSFDDDSEVAVGGDIILYKTTANVRFVSYLLSTRPHRKRIVFLSQGSTIRHVYASTLKAYEIALPSLAEQTAIAAVLSDMDAEIAVLGQRRDKTHALKQGMMQELLTGRTRLV